MNNVLLKIVCLSQTSDERSGKKMDGEEGGRETEAKGGGGQMRVTEWRISTQH